MHWYTLWFHFQPHSLYCDQVYKKVFIKVNHLATHIPNRSYGVLIMNYLIDQVIWVVSLWSVQIICSYISLTVLMNIAGDKRQL